MKWIAPTLALLIAGLVLKLSLLVYAMYVLLAVLVLTQFLTRAWVGSLEAHRRGGEGVFEIGDGVEIELEITNRGAFSVPWMIVEDALPQDALAGARPRVKADGARLAMRRLARGGSTALHYQLIFLMRGYYQLGPLLIETGDVFGLHRRYRIAGEPNFAMVLPNVVPLRGYNLASRRPLGEIRVSHRLFEDPTRLAGVRPYQQGDSLNRIHWRATARTGELHSRVFETSRVAGAIFLLDFHASSYEGMAGDPSSELAVTAVASLANAVCLMNQQLGLVTNGRDAADRIREEGWRADFLTRGEAHQRATAKQKNERLRPIILSAGRGIERFDNLLKTLARLEFSDGLSFPEMIHEAAPCIRRDATIVPVLRRVTEEGAAALGELARRGFLVTAIVVSSEDWELPDWARPPEWAEMLLANGIDFRLVNSEESISNLCAEAIIK